jgi:hypothetical protein
VGLKLDDEDGENPKTKVETAQQDGESRDDKRQRHNSGTNWQKKLEYLTTKLSVVQILFFFGRCHVERLHFAINVPSSLPSRHVPTTFFSTAATTAIGGSYSRYSYSYRGYSCYCCSAATVTAASTCHSHLQKRH